MSEKVGRKEDKEDEWSENLILELDLFEKSILRCEKYISDHSTELEEKMEEVENELKFHGI